MMSCNFRLIEVIEPSGIHLTIFQSVIPAPGSKDLVTLHILCTSSTTTLASGYACFILSAS